ncbi:hypothetical protein ACN2WE_30840 [Streptomyces sp. cg28]|uniref:hypothetical protein n=1 Tax=Streptomyces sp. cg28 TaxID=3403457 RepID=UPI003B224F7E
MPESPEPFIPIRHNITGEITTTGYNLAARRILLQSGFEETPVCTCRAADAGMEQAHEFVRQQARSTSPATPCPWAEPPGGR